MFTSWQDLPSGDQTHMQHALSALSNRMICSLYSSETTQMCKAHATFRLQRSWQPWTCSLSLLCLACMQHSCFLLCVCTFLCMCMFACVCVFCSNRTKDPFVQQACGFNVSSPNTMCAACIFMYTRVCCPQVCVFSLTVYQRRLELEFSVFVSLWSAAFAPGQADFRPPAFCQTPLAFLSSGYDPPESCCSKC